GGQRSALLSIDPGEMDTAMHAAALPDADPSRRGGVSAAPSASPGAGQRRIAGGVGAASPEPGRLELVGRLARAELASLRRAGAGDARLETSAAGRACRAGAVQRADGSLAEPRH